MKNTVTATEGALTPSSRSQDHARDKPTLDRHDHAGRGLDMTHIHEDNMPHDRQPNFPTSERGADPGERPTDRNHPGKGGSGAPTSPDSATPGRATGGRTAVGEDEAIRREGSPADDPPLHHATDSPIAWPTHFHACLTRTKVGGPPHTPGPRRAR